MTNNQSNLSPHERESGIRQIFAVGIRNPQWFGIRNPLWYGIQNPQWYGIRNPEGWNPEWLESRIQMLVSGITLVDSLTWGEIWVCISVTASELKEHFITVSSIYLPARRYDKCYLCTVYVQKWWMQQFLNNLKAKAMELSILDFKVPLYDKNKIVCVWLRIQHHLQC